MKKHNLRPGHVFAPSRFLNFVSIGIVSMGFMVFASCGTRPVAEVHQNFSGDCWPIQDTISLAFQIQDTSKTYKIFFPTSFTEAYRYSNLYVKFIVRAPNGLENGVPYQYRLMNEEGVWESSPSGDEIPFRLNLSGALRFNQTGEYTLRILHFMRDSLLCGVREAGMVIEKEG